MSVVQHLPVAALFQHCDPDQLDFETTNDLPDLDEALGQPRAVEAMRFGIGIEQDGYNIYAMGPAGTGKRTLVQSHFGNRAAQEPVPSDWCYIFNFQQPHKPRAIQLPSGKGSAFKGDMEHFVEELRTALSTAFESDEYRARRQVIEQEFQEEQENTFEGMQKKAKEQDFALIRTPAGLVFAPMKDGEVLSPEEFQRLPEEERNQMEANLEGLQDELKGLLQQAPRIQREIRDRLRTLNREIIEFSVGGLMDEMLKAYAGLDPVTNYLQEAREDIVENAQDFLSPEDHGDSGPSGILAALAGRMQPEQPAPLSRYQVNLLVDHRNSQGAPVIYEDNPTYQNLIGRVDHIAQMGALVTDFTQIKAGALHQANGGYLILDVRKVLQQPYAWEGLKRALQASQVKIESIGQMLSLMSTISLEPEPIQLSVKVALIGDRQLYYLLSAYDPDFDELFKVQADFDEQMERDEETQLQYARLIATLARRNNLRPLDPGAVARVIEHSARMAGDAERLTTQVREIANLLREANYWAGENGRGGADSGVVRAGDVEKAIEAQVYRADRLKQRMQEEILRGTYLIDTQGEKVGQINGLSVLQLGGYAFGRPSRITARVRMGKGDVVDIEREVDLAGPIHSKGVLILSSFLSGRYAQDRPLSLSASLVFEQSYGGVEGDSASTAELYVLLSAIAEAPIKQSLAVTGSVNQHGQVQAIGGVNEKIEGFFDICQARGLTGDQGVLIPASNVKHLMLRKDVIDAVEAGKFFIYPIEHVDQGIEMLTGLPAGEPDEAGVFPEGTINGKVQARLQKLAEKREALRRAAEEDEEKRNEDDSHAQGGREPSDRLEKGQG